MTANAEPTTGGVLKPRPSRALEIVAAIIAVAFCAGYLALATRIELRQETADAIDARTWPTILGIAGLAASIVWLGIAIARPAPHRDDLERISRGGPLRVVLVVILTAAFIAVWGLGDVIVAGYRIQLFPIVAAVYLIALMLVFGHRRWAGLVAYPILLTAFIYGLFGMLLRIPL